MEKEVLDYNKYLLQYNKDLEAEIAGKVRIIQKSEPEFLVEEDIQKYHTKHGLIYKEN